jgi:hypothetical protein
MRLEAEPGGSTRQVKIAAAMNPRRCAVRDFGHAVADPLFVEIEAKMSNKTAVVTACLMLLGFASAAVAKEQPTPVPKRAVGVQCRTTDFTRQPGQVDQAVVFEDPAHQQTVLFDITAGGAIVSLKYRGVEHIWGNNAGAMLQMALHHNIAPSYKATSQQAGDYNPTQAGDEFSSSPVTGVACHGTASVDIETMMLDFNTNASLFQHPLIAVWGGRVSSGIPPSYFAPYTLETRASWVRSPGPGGPKYYLRLDERITHLTKDGVGPFVFDFADYAPWEFDVRITSPEGCPCATSSTNYLAGGLYTDQSKNVGLAVAIPGSDFPKNEVSAASVPDYQWRMRSVHLEAREALDGIVSKDYTWYVMVGPWRGALEFAQHFMNAGASR